MRGEGVVLRGLTRDDLPALLAAMVATEDVDRTGEHYNLAELVEEAEDTHTDLGRDWVGAFGPAGEVLGWFRVFNREPAGGVHKLVLDAATVPAHRGRGIGSRLARAMLARCDEVAAAQSPHLPTAIVFNAPSARSEQAALLAEVGLLPDRWSFIMRCHLDAGPLPEPVPLPNHLVARRYTATDDEDLRLAHNEAFVDHPGFTPWSRALWDQWVTRSRTFRPDDSWVVRDARHGDRLVAYVQTSEYEGYAEATGRREAFVGKVGTLRGHRGQGVATSLLSRALAGYRDAGYAESCLVVDSANPTGALGVYERAGFVVEARWTDYLLRREASSTREP